jgi:uncharacterized protein (TIGR04255 family)
MVRAEIGAVAKQGYARAPIVEAVFDVRFSEVLSERDMERLKDRLKSRYPTVEDRKNIKIEVKADKVITTSNPAGYKMTASNAMDVILIQTNDLGSARLAPYQTWEDFIGVARENYEVFTKIVGRKTLTRVATRFVNRFDIPTEEIEGHDVAEWISTSIVLPESLTKAIGPYSFAVNFIHQNTGTKVLIQSGIIAPALLKHVSINLDIDVSVDTDISAHKDEIVKIAPRLREAKNSVFESLITDKLRAKFR